MTEGEAFVSTFRVYYEDTDMAGIVYYANYLKFLERGRSDVVRAVGIDQMEMRDGRDLVFAVARIEIDYHAPARFGDVLKVCTETSRVGGATLEMPQRIYVGERLIISAFVRVACMNTVGKIQRFPRDIREALTNRQQAVG